VPYEFCTLFDANYLPRALVLHGSLLEHCRDARLHAYCMDDTAARVLEELDLPGIRVVRLAELEARDPALASAKPSRSPIEYCWTATPAVCLDAFESEPELDAITYLDADLMFFSDPAVLFAEIGDASTTIVPHRYTREYAGGEATNGVYNVGWLTFRRDPPGLEALRWWHERCIEWCYARFEDGKMGDQKYLDDWPERFEGVHVLEHPGGGLAPWNVARYELAERDGHVTVDRRDLVFFHHHSLRLYEPTAAARAAAAAGLVLGDGASPWAVAYRVTARQRRLIWEPYVRRLAGEVERVRSAAPGLRAGVDRWSAREHFALRRLVRVAKGAVRGQLIRLLPPVGAGQEDLRGSWRDEDVARRMAKLTERQLAEPEAVAPFRSFRAAIEALLERDGLPSPVRVFDVGCGIGGYADLLERYFPGRFEYVGADSSEAVLAAARRRSPGRTFEQRDLLVDGVPDGYEVILASALIDVVPEWEAALERLFAADAPVVLLHRQRIAIHRPSRVETASGYGDQRTYATRLNLGDIESAAARHGRRVVDQVHVEGDVYSFLIVREDAA
jgi:SAM-dependent methyltransferase